MARRVKIRRTPPYRGTLTAAGQKITDPSKTFKSSIGGSGSDWQEQAWEFLDKVGELRYYVGWRSASVGRCRLVGSDIDPVTGRPTGFTDNPAVQRIVRDIAGGVSGQTQMLKRLATALTVPGEGYVAMLIRDSNSHDTYSDGSPLSAEDRAQLDFQEWVVLSRDEIKKSGAEGLEFTLQDGTKHEYNPDQDLLFRVWNPHPRKASEADSPVRAAEDALMEIVRTTKSIDNAAKSRLVGNGIVFIPQEMSLPDQNAPGATPMAGDAPAPIDPTYAAPSASQQLQELLYQVGTTAYKDQESMAAFLPIIASVPGEWTDKVKHVTFDSAVAETSLKTREAAIRRLAMSLDVAPEQLLGLGSSNHWSAWALAEDDVKVHVVPVLETIVESLTRFVLRPMLENAGVDPDHFVIWYDTTPLTQDPDKKAEAQSAHDRGAITSKALREYSGFGDEDAYDLTTPDGWQQLARDKAAADVSLIPTLAPLLGAAVGEIQAPAQQPAIEPNQSAPATVEDPDTLPESEPVQQPDSTDEPEAVTSSVSIALVDTFVARALELANKRRRNRANAHAFRDIPVHLAHRNLPKLPVEEVPKLIEGWDTSVPWPTVERLGFTRATVTAWVEADVYDALSGI